MNHSGDTNKMVSETPSVCPFCGSYVATLDDGKPCGDSEGNWTAFRCLTSWHRGYHDPRKLQSKTCETVERHKLYDRIKRMEEARTIAAANSLANIMSYEDAIAKIKRLEEAGDALYELCDPSPIQFELVDQIPQRLKAWEEAKEAKP